MSITDILIYIDDAETGFRTITVAQKLAEQFDAHLAGLYVIPPANVPVYSGIEAAVSTAALAQLEIWLKERADLARENFEKLTAVWESKVSWISIEGEKVSIINDTAKNYDIIVIRQSNPNNRDDKNKGIVDKVALESGRPTLVIPYSGFEGHWGKRILIAWNGKREATRAVHDALPFLIQADSVNIVSVNASKDLDIPCADMAEHLARHGVPIETEKAYAHNNAVGEQLLSLATTYSADMLVMGAYGHSRFRELVLGGTTHTILDKMTIPVLMSH